MEVNELFKPNLLDEAAPLTSNPDGFLGNLHVPQAAVLYRMLKMEKEQYVVVKPKPDEEEKSWTLLKFNAGRLGAAFGFGKTVIIVALVAKQIPPKRAPFRINIPNFDKYSSDPLNMDVSRVSVRGESSYSRNRNKRREFPRPPLGDVSVTTDVQVMWKPTLFTGTTLIVAANSIISHWEETVRKFAPHLNAFTVDGVEKMRELIEMFSTGIIEDYHIILLKVGSMAAPFGVKKSFSTLEIICKFLPGYVWDRVVIDDYDCINLPSRASMPPAFFTWYVSATDRNSLTSVTNMESEPIAPTPDAMKNSLMKFFPGFWPTSAASRNELLASTLLVNCTSEFRESQFILPAPIYTDYKMRKTGADAMLDHVDLSSDVREALNGGAVHTAAEMMGMHCKTSTELVVRILRQNIETYEIAAAEITTLERVKVVLQGRLQLPSMKDATLSATRDLLREVKNGWRCPSLPEITGAEFVDWLRVNHVVPASHFPLDMCFSAKYDEALDRFLQERTAVRNKAAQSISRLRENAEFNECQVCLLSWDEIEEEESIISNHRFLTNCCQSLLCCVCVTHNRQFVDLCPSCGKSTMVDGVRQILSFGADIDVSSLNLPKALAQRQAIQKERTEQDWITEIWEDFGRDNKIRALMQLVAGMEVSCDSTTKGREIPGLMGNCNPQVPPPQRGKKRFLIFSYHPESTRRILEAFEKSKIKSALLRGKSKEKDKVIFNFRRSTRDQEILIITGSNDCAGIHLPEATDIIFFHRMKSPEVESQLGGRAQRPGRKYSVLVHNLTY